MRRSADFSTTVRQGVRTGRPRLVVHLAPGPAGAEAGPTTAGFVVSKAVGGAVVRNQVKRRLRHLVAARLDRVPAGSRVVVRALAPAASASSAQLGRDLDEGLGRAAGRLSSRGSASRGTRSSS